MKKYLDLRQPSQIFGWLSLNPVELSNRIYISWSAGYIEERFRHSVSFKHVNEESILETVMDGFTTRPPCSHRRCWLVIRMGGSCSFGEDMNSRQAFINSKFLVISFLKFVIIIKTRWYHQKPRRMVHLGTKVQMHISHHSTFSKESGMYISYYIKSTFIDGGRLPFPL